MKIDPMKAIALILIGAFVIDRIVAGLFFLLSYSEELRDFLDPSSVEDPSERAAALRNYRLLYAIFGGYLGTVVLAGYMGVRVFSTGAVQGAEFIGQYPLLDILVTGLILLGGADRLSEALRLLGSGSGSIATSKDKPLELTGKFVVERSPNDTNSTADKKEGPPVSGH
jgi:hypothetical protein